MQSRSCGINYDLCPPSRGYCTVAVRFRFFFYFSFFLSIRGSCLVPHPIVISVYYYPGQFEASSYYGDTNKAEKNVNLIMFTIFMQGIRDSQRVYNKFDEVSGVVFNIIIVVVRARISDE